MKKIIMLLLLLIPSMQGRAADVLLNLNRSGDLVIVSIVNLSEHDMKVSKVFTINPAFGLFKFYVNINGHRHPSVSYPDEIPPSVSDYTILSPFDVVGRAFDISEIRRRYRTGKDCFDLHVEYHDIRAQEFGAYQGTLESNTIDVCEKRRGAKAGSKEKRVSGTTTRILST